ncbi:MAG TPA: hypothetical protein VIO64_18240 [Pseudobacteroides sp.]|uniref:hypothetical protein n=1 Tax=Pseudobacteroides sp. TaxID=1968840 RepID=UPI002F922EF6
MERWKGKLKAREFEANVEIFYRMPTYYTLGEWYGYGTVTQSIEEREYETNLGSIIVNNIKDSNYSKLLFGFTGNGDLFLPRE